jgi:hypothetical protein
MEYNTMFTTLIKLEMAFLEKLTREELLTMLLERMDGLELDFTREWLEAHSSDRLRLFLLAARLFRVLRQKECRAPAVTNGKSREDGASEKTA